MAYPKQVRQINYPHHTFKSISEAAEVLDCSLRSVQWAIATGRPCKGAYLELVGVEQPMITLEIDGQQYTVSEASKKIGCHSDHLYRKVRKHKTAGEFMVKGRQVKVVK